ncbi:MAG: LTA synthase family protein [Bacteroidaceae bacterium]|nr:LTA synthase family protein [Bacteroidaceae bacterium]
MRSFLKILRFLLSVHITGLILTTLLRCALFIVCHNMLSAETVNHTFLPLGAFLRGLWFDNVIGCYILIVPLFVCMVSCTFGYAGKHLLRPVLIWMQVLWSVVFFVSAANIPYFQYFFKNINSSIWNWAEYGTQTFGLLFGEPSYYPPLIGFIILVVLFVLFTNLLMHKTVVSDINSSHRWATICIGITMMGLCIFGIRGRTGYNPIKVSAAYYCDDAFLNQLGVSPTFNLLATTRDDFRTENQPLALMDVQTALNNVKKYYPAIQTDTLSSSSRVHLQKKNLIVILMESMSANLMGTFGNTDHLTPFIDSLASQSILFTNFYSTGIHTNQGMFATLYSYPAVLDRNMMKGTNIPSYEGLPTVMKSLGYRTMFFMTHESQYDNMNAFFRTNGYEEIYSQENYPSDKVVNSFGVQDDFLYGYALNKLNETPSQPFFATILSISNHPPYVVPPYFHPRSKKIDYQIVEYADWSLQQFFESAKTQPWYSNTIFVLLADHGLLWGQAENEIPQSYNHIPFMIYNSGLPPQHNESWGVQMDVQPTILDVMGIEPHEWNFGIDLFKHQRPCAFFCADDIMGARNTNHLYIYSPKEGREVMYKNGKQTTTFDAEFLQLKDYLLSNLQAADALTKGK